MQHPFVTAGAKRLVSGSVLFLILIALLGCEQLSDPGANQAPTVDAAREADDGAGLVAIADDAATLEYVQATSGQPVIVENEKGLQQSMDDGTISSFAWRQVSGAKVYLEIEGVKGESTRSRFTPSVPGTYVFELVATDLQGRDLVVDRQAVVVQGRGTLDAATPKLMTCAVALLPEGVEASPESLARAEWTTWAACPGGGIRLSGGDLDSDGDGLPDVVEGTLTLVKELDKATPLLYQGIRSGGSDTDGDGYGDVRVHSLVFGEEVEILGIGEEQATDRPMGRLKTGDITLERLYQGAFPRPEIFVLAQEAARDPSVSGDDLVEPDETFTVTLRGADGDGDGGTQVALSRCVATEYMPFVIDQAASEPVERLSMRCEHAEFKAEGPGQDLYAWVGAALQGKPEPRTLVIKEVLPDGSDGRVFVSTGAFPKDWTLPARSGSPLYESDTQTGSNPLYEGHSSSTMGIEKITLAVENMYQE
ncbi:MAG: hypothetical protein WD942_07770 [Dehalococcoidia bacterium]